MSGQILRPYQIACIDAVAAAQARGLTRVLVQAATGVGKSSCFSALPERLAPWLSTFSVHDRKVLIIAHRQELIDQAAQRVQMFNPKLTVSVEQGDRVSNRYADVTVASIQTLTALKCRRLKRLLNHSTYRLVVYDECQHSSSPTARTALVHLGFLPPADASENEDLEAPSYDDVVRMEDALKGWAAVAPKDRLLVGFTATPNRSDGIGLGAVFEEIVFSYPIRQAISDGWLVPIVPYVVETATSLDDVRTTAGEFNQKDLATTVNTPARNQLAVKGWLEYAPGLPTVAFTVDVQHAHDLAEMFRVAGVRARAVSGETPREDRAQAVTDFTAGRLDVLTNCQIWTEGVDLPRVACVLMAKPTKSATLFCQCIGRGLRLFAGKKSCVLIDVVDVARRHSLQISPSLYGLPPGLTGKGETLDQMAEAYDALLDQYPQLEDVLAGQRLSIEQLRITAKTFDVWSIPDLGAFGQVATMNWIKTGDQTFTISYPWNEEHETIQVSPDLLGKWEVVCTLRPKEGPKRQRTIAHGIVDQQAAATMAEAFMQQERRNVLKLKDRSAPWRTGSASPKQMATLKKFKVPFNPAKITKGEASDLLDLAFSRLKQRGGR